MRDDEHQKRDEIKTRLRSTQKENEVLYTMIQRTKKMIQRARLERSFLLERLEEFAKQPTKDDGDMDSSPPGSPAPHLDPNDASTERAERPEPKRPANTGNKRPNAYTMFCEQERDGLVRNLESQGQFLRPTAIQSRLSEMWKSLSKEEKKPFAERARDLKRKDQAAGDSDEEPAKDETEEPPDSVPGSEATPMPETEPSSETDALSEH